MPNDCYYGFCSLSTVVSPAVVPAPHQRGRGPGARSGRGAPQVCLRRRSGRGQSPTFSSTKSPGHDLFGDGSICIRSTVMGGPEVSPPFTCLFFTIGVLGFVPVVPPACTTLRRPRAPRCSAWLAPPPCGRSLRCL